MPLITCYVKRTFLTLSNLIRNVPWFGLELSGNGGGLEKADRAEPCAGMAAGKNRQRGRWRSPG
jgi:hypothetical protein